MCVCVCVCVCVCECYSTKNGIFLKSKLIFFRFFSKDVNSAFFGVGL